MHLKVRKGRDALHKVQKFNLTIKLCCHFDVNRQKQMPVETVKIGICESAFHSY